MLVNSKKGFIKESGVHNFVLFLCPIRKGIEAGKKPKNIFSGMRL
jgi:hypothetical protein